MKFLDNSECQAVNGGVPTIWDILKDYFNKKK